MYFMSTFVIQIVSVSTTMERLKIFKTIRIKIVILLTSTITARPPPPLTTSVLFAPKWTRPVSDSLDKAKLISMLDFTTLSYVDPRINRK